MESLMHLVRPGSLISCLFTLASSRMTDIPRDIPIFVQNVDFII